MFPKRDQEPFHRGRIVEGGFQLYGHKYARKARLGGVGRPAPGTKVTIAFQGPGPRDNPVMIGTKGSASKRLFIHNLTPPGTLVAALWSQAKASGGLNPLALACFRPDPTASTSTVWSGLGGHYNDFPVLLDKDARPVMCFAERKIDDSNWDKLRVVIATGSSSELAFECDWTGTDTAGGMIAGFSACSSDANIVYFSEVNKRKAWRKRGEVLEEITLTGLNSNHGYDHSNMNDAGLLIFPRYYRHYTGNVSYADYVAGAPLGSPTATWTSDAVQVEQFALDIEDAAIPKAQIDPALLFDYAHPGMADFSGKHAFDSQGRLLVWASARDSFDPSEAGFDAAACVGWEANNYQLPRPIGGDFIYPNQATAWGRKIAGVLACINGNTTVWRHTIEKTASEPLENSQLIDPYDAAFATQTEDNSYTDDNATSAATYPANDLRPVPHVPFSSITYGGIAAPGSLNSSVRNIVGEELGSLYFGPYYLFYNEGDYTGFPPTDDPYAVTGHVTSGGNFALPRYDHYNGVAIELLPRGRNFAKPTRHPLDADKRNNWDVYSSWAGPTSQQGSSVVVKRPEDSPYICYTVPRSCFFGGFSTLQGHVSSLGATAPYAFAKQVQEGWNQYFQIARSVEDGGPYELTVDPFTYPLWGSADYGLGGASFIRADQIEVTGHYVRGLSYLSERYISKLNSDGTLAWEKNLTQLMAGAECWRSRTEMGLRPSGDDLIGAVSTEELPLGDDLGPARPAGRVVFLPADFHELGPNFLPTQRLLILDDSNGDLLHTLPLTDAGDGDDPDEVLEEDAREPSTEEPIETNQSFTADGVTNEFEISGDFVEWTYVQDHVGNYAPEDSPPFHFEGSKIVYDEIPPEGSEITISYVSGYETTLGELLWEAGEKRIDATVKEIHLGVDPAAKEWAMVSIEVVDRLPGGGRNGPRLLRLKMGTDIAVAPDASWGGSISTREAIHGGSIYRLSSNGAGTANSILRKTNPSTT